MEKISIIVPIYNVEKYLKQCIDSIIAQTYTNIEIILVDDGSPDNSGNICDEYAKKDCRIKVIHKQNGGLSDARNAGIKVASGELIGFVDSDDYIANDMYELLYNNLKKENAQISCCNRYICYKNKNTIYGINNFYEVMDSMRAIELMCTYGYIGFSAYTKLYKKELFDNIKFPKGKVCEDMFIMYKLFDLANVIVYDANPKYYYIQRKGSISRNKKNKIDAIESSKEIVEFVRKHYKPIENVAIKNYIYTSIGVYNVILKNKSKEDNIELVHSILSEINKYYKVVIEDKEISKARKIELWLIQHYRNLYDIIFLLYDNIKNKLRKLN